MTAERNPETDLRERRRSAVRLAVALGVIAVAIYAWAIVSRL